MTKTLKVLPISLLKRKAQAQQAQAQFEAQAQPKNSSTMP